MAMLYGTMAKSIQKIKLRASERYLRAMSYMRGNSKTIRLMGGADRFTMGTGTLKASFRTGFCMGMGSTSMAKEVSMKAIGSKASLKAKMKLFRLTQITKIK